LINTGADNLRGQGANIRDSVIKLSQAFSVLGDHSDDIFSTIKHLSVLVSALHDSADLLSQLNRNLASVSALVADDPTAVADAVNDLNTAVGDATGFITENREALGTTTDKLSSITKAVTDSTGEIKQLQHTAPN
jgi:phospholipid/cholesterol/gamma-HCH transport system substrate-binding protein